MSNVKETNSTDVIATILLIGILFFFQSFVFWKCWQWFVMPVWTIELSYVQTLGLWFALRFVTLQHRSPQDDKTPLERLADMFAYSLLALVVGFIIHAVIN